MFDMLHIMKYIIRITFPLIYVVPNYYCTYQSNCKRIEEPFVCLENDAIVLNCSDLALFELDMLYLINLFTLAGAFRITEIYSTCMGKLGDIQFNLLKQIILLQNGKFLPNSTIVSFFNIEFHKIYPELH